MLRCKMNHCNAPRRHHSADGNPAVVGLSLRYLATASTMRQCITTARLRLCEAEKPMNSSVSARLEELVSAARAVERGAPPPLERWNPPDCGEIDMRIGRDGTWFYAGTPINRPAMVRLFASVLKREGERYVLVTPVEKVGIRVEDAPFIAVDMASDKIGDEVRLVFRTNLDDLVICDHEHPLRFETDGANGGLRPYIYVRRDLWARLTPALALDLAACGEVREVEGEAMFGVASAGAFFPIVPAAALDVS
jgi:hypothetical protein